MLGALDAAEPMRQRAVSWRVVQMPYVQLAVHAGSCACLMYSLLQLCCTLVQQHANCVLAGQQAECGACAPHWMMRHQ